MLCLKVLSGSPAYGFSAAIIQIYAAVTQGGRPWCGQGLVWDIAKRCWVANSVACPSASRVLGWLEDTLQGGIRELPSLPANAYLFDVADS